ncbi:DUF1028 domain-containing protein [Burkholderia sp. WAC0059]|uniref:DUF1028 domain-containing protein n=1 Tax=Burkholderia sp. WAC0059 TaxID=2066022 RepID=UPI000C7F5B4E|nr:DUF1028 domain-containing protein [Burkholderia sp. WAC0059]PLZ00864.1 DUF1028 domain-containing protein [Burkholderia sp. WAC0059]
MTFSIVARCARTGQLGVAVSTAVPAVGAMCPYLRPNVGAVTTQSWVNPYLALRALERLEAGDSAEAALGHVLRTDPSADLRQLGIVDRAGRGVAWTGPSCTGWAGDRRGPGYTVQGNMLVGPETLDAMAGAFEASVDAPLAQRLMAALEAGQAAGGDRRGRQSAALKVVGEEEYALLDLRVDEHPDPVAELRRVFGVARHQLAPFVAGMPTRDDPGRAPPADVTAMLLASPAERPGASLPDGDPAADSAVLARWMGTRFAPGRVTHNLAVYRDIAGEIARLRELDLAALHPAIVFDPLRGREPEEGASHG